MYDITIWTKNGVKYSKKETIKEVNNLLNWFQWNNEIEAIMIASYETNKSYLVTVDQVEKNYKIGEQHMLFSAHLKTEMIDGIYFEVNKFNKIVFIGR